LLIRSIMSNYLIITQGFLKANLKLTPFIQDFLLYSFLFLRNLISLASLLKLELKASTLVLS